MATIERWASHPRELVAQASAEGWTQSAARRCDRCGWEYTPHTSTTDCDGGAPHVWLADPASAIRFAEGTRVEVRISYPGGDVWLPAVTTETVYGHSNVSARYVGQSGMQWETKAPHDCVRPAVER